MAYSSVPDVDFYDKVDELLREEYEREKKRGNKAFTFPLNESIKMLQHQWDVLVYMSSGVRGLLVYHHMGFGKTRTAIMVAEYLLHLGHIRRCVIISPLSVVNNFLYEISLVRGYIVGGVPMTAYSKKEVKEITGKLKDIYSFVTLKSINMLTTFETATTFQATGGKIGEFDRDLGIFAATVESLDDVLVIMDEVHELTNAVYNGSTNAMELFLKIMNAERARVLCLTGTPIVNEPYETAILFNMIRGPMSVKERGHRATYYAFGDNSSKFNETFITKTDTTMIANPKYVDKYRERISGLTSFMSLDSLPEEDKARLPRQRNMEMIELTMSDYQWSLYVHYRKLEVDRETRARKFKAETKHESYKKPRRKFGAGYRVLSRMVSNFAIPDYVKVSNGRPESILAAIKDEDFSESALKKYSPKLSWIRKKVAELDEKSAGVVLIYSNFLYGGGVLYMAKMLEMMGYRNVNDRIKTSLSNVGGSIVTIEDYRGFITFTGDTPQVIRDAILIEERKEENLHGKLVKIVLLSSAGSLGVNLKHVKTVIIMEPHWHMTRLFQTLSRAIRIGSLDGYPPKDRVVDVFVLTSGKPKNANLTELFGEGEITTTDLHLYRRALKNQTGIKSFEELIATTSFHCKFSGGKDCFRCNSGESGKMFEEDIVKHLILPSRCRRRARSTVT